MTAETVAAVLAALVVGLAGGIGFALLWQRRREARRLRALQASLGPRTDTQECLECGATYEAGSLFCKRCGAWPGQTG